MTRNESVSTSEPRKARGIEVAAIALLYLASYWALEALDWISFIYPFRMLDITPWNPPVAASVILLLLRDFRWTPMLFVAAVSSDVLVRHQEVPLAPALISDATETLIYAGAVWVAKARLGIDTDLRNFRDILVFIGIGVLAPAFQAVAYVTSFWWVGMVPTDQFSPLILEYWVGDAIGLTIVGSFFLVNRRALHDIAWMRSIVSREGLAQAGCIALAVWVLFFLHFPDGGYVSYVLFLPVIWIAARYGLPGATLALLLIQLAVVGTADVLHTESLRVTKLQFLMLSLSWTGLLLGAVISERERARASVARGEARLQTIVDMAPDGMLISDEAGRVGMVNKQFEALYGSSRAEIVGKGVTDLLSQPNPYQPDDVVIRRPDGREAPVEVSTAVVPFQSGHGSVITVRDATVRKQADARLQQRRTAVERVSRSNLADELAAIMAHELNQPLAAIIGYAEACRKILVGTTTVPARAFEQLAKLMVQAERAGAIIRHLRDFFKSSNIEAEPVRVSDLVRNVFELLGDEIARVGLVVEVDIPEWLVVEIDRLKIEQVMINLIRNSLEALTEVPRGSRRLQVASKTSVRDGVEIVVTDTGPGIAAEVEEQLFDPFVTTRATGMGLGLAISRSIVQAHGGRIWFEPHSSSGASVHFTLGPPRRASENAAR